MRRLALFLMVFSLLFVSCEKDEGDKGCVKNIAFSTSSSFVGVTGILTEATKYKYLVISETPNVSEATGVVYCDSANVSTNFSIRASNLYSNTKYYLKVFYRDASGKTIYSPEYTVNTGNSTAATTFNSVVKLDTLIGGRACHLLKYSFKTISDLRNAEFGVCYSKATDPGTAPVPTVSDKVIKGTLGKDGIVTCDISEVNFNEMENVRPYFKNSKETVYGSVLTYSKPSWLPCMVLSGSYSFNLGAISYKGKGYVFSGGGSSDMWSFSPAGMTWSKEVSIKDIFSIDGNPYEIFTIKAAPISNGFLFFSNGLLTVNRTDYVAVYSNCIYSYNTTSKAYTQILPNGLPDVVFKYSKRCDGFGINGQPYVAIYGGSVSNEELSRGTYIYAYDEVSRTFKEVTANSERTGVKDAAFFAVGNMVFMGAGSYSVFETLTTDFWSYNVSTKVWTRLKDAPISKFVKSFVYKNRCFAIGSDNNLYEYGVGNDSWTIVEKIPYTIDAVMPIDDGLYLLNGNRILKNVSL